MTELILFYGGIMIGMLIGFHLGVFIVGGKKYD